MQRGDRQGACVWRCLVEQSSFLHGHLLRVRAEHPLQMVAYFGRSAPQRTSHPSPRSLPDVNACRTQDKSRETLVRFGAQHSSGFDSASRPGQLDRDGDE